METDRIRIKHVLGGDAVGATIYALVFSFYTIAFSLDFNLAIIRLSYILYYAVSLWYFFKVLVNRERTTFIKVLNTFLAIITVYGLFILIQGTGGWDSNLKASSFLFIHYTSVLPVYSFYYFGSHNKINGNWFALMFLLFAVDTYCLYYHNRLVVSSNVLNAEEGFTNNVGYEWASLLPLIVFFDKRKILQYLSIGIIMFFVLTCFKRGAIVISMAVLLFFFLSTIRKEKMLRKISIVVLTIIVTVLLLNYFDSIVSSYGFFNDRLERTMQGDSSGRDVIYSRFISFLFSPENGFKFFYGNGAFATVKLFGIEAHNDWLEYAIDMGLIGVFVYLTYWVCVIKNYRFFSKKHVGTPIMIAMGMGILFNLLRSFFSMSFYDMSFFSAAVLGYTMSIADQDKRMGIHNVH